MNRKLFVIVLVVAVLLVSVVPAFAQSVELDVDIGPLFDQLNVFFPIFFAIFAIVGGIAGALVLARTIINAIVGAFRSGFSGGM